MLKIKERMYNDSGKLVFGKNMNELKECCGEFPDRTERSEHIYCKDGDMKLLLMHEEIIQSYRVFEG